MDDASEGAKTAAPLPRTAQEALLTPSALNFPVVGIGASAGGLDALLSFFGQMPSDSGMAFVVILHLSPRHTSSMDSLLQSVTPMKVTQVTEPTRIEPNRIFVISPTRDLTMNDGYLRVAEAERPRGRHVAIDVFFRTLAVVHRERAIAIVMSGMGSDGAVGITRVKEQGGLTLAQAPDDAEFDAMPRAAIATHMIDWVLPAAELPAKLLGLWANAQAIELPPGTDDEVQTRTAPSGDPARQAEAALREIMVVLRARTGHNFQHYKRATVLRRLERRLQVNGVHNLPSYLELLTARPDEAQALLKDLLIGVTNFFRDREAFEALEREVMPKLLRPNVVEDEPLRVWVAGCATGEEAYSVAMLLAEQADAAHSLRELQVFATDIDEAAIATARAGTYPESIVTDVPPTRLRHFFNREAGQYRVRKEIREKVLFAPHNLLRDPPFSKLDLVCCRNLLIYLDRDVQTEVLQMFHFALKPGGYLFLGSSESADAVAQSFTPVDKKHRIYRANLVTRAARGLPSLPLGSYPRRPYVGSSEAPAEPGRLSYAEVHRRLLEQHLPPSVLIDAGGSIVHLSERAGRFLRHVAGAPSHQLLTVVKPELRIELRTALFQAQQSGKSVEARRVRLAREGDDRYVTMTVRLVPPSALGDRMALVLFDEVEDTLETGLGGAGDGGEDSAARHLEEELRRTNERLQLTVEQAETSTEELKASNEELQAINEELRSTSEELETSKEELQSINEELITVNHELKMKVEETGKINDDLTNLIASTDIATVFVDRTMGIKRYTPRAVQIFSIIPGDIGRSLLDITHRLDYDGLAADAAESFQSLRVLEREVAAADSAWYLLRVVPYRTVEDRIDGAVLTFLDITERRRAEQRLHAEEQRMRMMAESTRDYAIVTFDAEGRITSWNSGAEAMFGHTAAEAVGQPTELLFTPEDRAAGVAQEELRQAREQGRAADDRWHLRRDGTRFFCSGSMTPLRDDAGVLRGYAKIARDLTHLRESEHEREAQLRRETAGRAEALAAGELKDEFLAVMSHELKNPLNLIHLNAELLSRLPEARALPPVARAAEVIRKAVLSQAQIIDDLLDLSRMNTGKLALAVEAVDWGAVVRTIADAMAEEAGVRGLALAVTPPDAPVVVAADPVRVEQIVWNLLSNALKFTPEGGRVAVRLVAEGGFGVLTVHDTGRGIDPEHLPRLFGMFQQAASPTARHERGLGIGLALVRQLAELQGGRLEGTSPGLGQGATFTAWLPLHGPAGRPDADGAAGPGLPPGLRALVVDDDRQNAETLGDLLRLDGLTVTLALSAAEALEALRQAHFDVVLSDIAMPETDGYQLVATLRRQEEGQSRRLPVIALTGFGRVIDAKKAIDAGFDAHLSKPVTLDRLTAALLRVLRERPPAP